MFLQQKFLTFARLWGPESGLRQVEKQMPKEDQEVNKEADWMGMGCVVILRWCSLPSKKINSH